MNLDQNQVFVKEEEEDEKITLDLFPFVPIAITPEDPLKR
jgi:hypothetical protein